MNKRKWLGLMIFVLAITMLAACSNKNLSSGDQPPTDSTDQHTNQGTDGNQQENPDGDKGTEDTNGTNSNNGSGSKDTSSGQTDKPSANKQQQTITVYATDDELMDLQSETTTITFSNVDEKIQAALKALQTDGKKTVALWKKIEFKSWKLDDKGMLTLDVHVPEDGHLGAGGESYAIEALTKTLFQFDEVKSIDILVDGEATESLMGHVMLEHPYVRP